MDMNYKKEGFMNDQKPEQTLEKSVRYIASYLKFELKKDLLEIVEPFKAAIQAIANTIYRGKNGS
jgi:hypothetical protein